MIRISFIIIFSISFFALEAQNATDLPGWVTDIPKSNAKKIYTLGISDTKMEEGDAYRLAFLRAKAMLTLFHNSQIKQVADLYESQKEQGAELNAQTLDKLSKFYSKYVVDSAQIEVLKQIYTEDQEVILLVREIVPSIDTAKCKDTIIVEGSSYMNEYKIDESSKLVKSFELGVLEITCKTKDSLKLFYECADENNVDFTIKSTFMDSIFTSFSTMHEYKNTTSNEINSTEYLGSSNLKKGLWKAYIDAVLQNMISLTNIMASKTKNASDAYKNDGNTESISKDEHLFRNISSNQLSLVLRGIEISKNTLWVKMTAVSFVKSELQQKTEKILDLLKKPLYKLK